MASRIPPGVNAGRDRRGGPARRSMRGGGDPGSGAQTTGRPEGISTGPAAGGAGPRFVPSPEANRPRRPATPASPPRRRQGSGRSR